MVEQNESHTDQAEASAQADQPEVGESQEQQAVAQTATASDEQVPSPDEEVSSEVADESEIAADYLEELLDIADLDGDIDIEVRQNRAYLSVVTEENADDLELLVGRHGEVLDSLQELVRLAALAATGERSRLILDVAGYRDRRGNELETMAKEAMDAVKESGEAFHLTPLSAYERKIVHDFVAENGFHSESEGDGSKRHIVVSLNSAAEQETEVAE